MAHRPLFDPASHLHNDIFDSIVHPYSASAFRTSLEKHALISSYPLLVNKLLHGFPLGSMPRLEKMNIFPIYPTCAQYTEFIDDYLSSEVSCGRMLGPFTREETERVLRGPFLSSPLIIDVQPQQPGTPDKLRLCRHLSKGNRVQESANSYILKEQFPTRFDTASRVAHLVSLVSCFLFPHHFLPSFSWTLCVSCVSLLRSSPHGFSEVRHSAWPPRVPSHHARAHTQWQAHYASPSEGVMPGLIYPSLAICSGFIPFTSYIYLSHTSDAHTHTPYPFRSFSLVRVPRRVLWILQNFIARALCSLPTSHGSSSKVAMANFTLTILSRSAPRRPAVTPA